MLATIIPCEATPRPATSHILNQPTVGVGSPAGDSGAGGVSGAGAAHPARRGRGLAVLFGLIDENHPNAISRLDRLDGVGGDAA